MTTPTGSTVNAQLNLHFDAQTDTLVWEGIAVQPIRAFPLTAANEAIALVDEHGHERVFLPDGVEGLEPSAAKALRDALAHKSLMPTIFRIVAVSARTAPCVWEIETDRGSTRLELRGEDGIRRLPAASGGGLLVTDAYGMHYRIVDAAVMDRASRRFLDLFL